MTVKELIEALQSYPEDADVFVYDIGQDDAAPLDGVSASVDDPDHEVYLDFKRFGEEDE